MKPGTPAVAVDARMIGMGGIGRYTESLLCEMLRVRPAHFRWILVGDPGRLRPLAAAARDAAVEIRDCRARIYSAEEAFGMSRYFAGADLVHVPHFNAPLAAGPAKLIVTLHDLIHFDYPEYQPFPFANRILEWKLKRLLKRADGILTVSQATADALRKRYPSLRLEKKCKVIWEGAEAVFNPAAKQDDADRLRRMRVDATRPYVLYVGAIREHKQVHVLAGAFDRLKTDARARSAQLVLAGKLDARFDRKHGFASRILQNPDIRHVADADDADLAALYRHAAVFTLPSAAEGFGLPVVEAMQSGTPVVVSDIPVLKEIAGDAALAFPAGDAAALASTLLRVLTDTGLKFELAGRSLEKAKRFDLFKWSHTATQTLELYEKVLSSR